MWMGLKVPKYRPIFLLEDVMVNDFYGFYLF